MSIHSSKTALIFASILGATAAMPLAAALADTMPTVPATTAVSNTPKGVYDGADQFKDATGRPLSGWQNVIFSANT